MEAKWGPVTQWQQWAEMLGPQGGGSMELSQAVTEPPRPASCSHYFLTHPCPAPTGYNFTLLAAMIMFLIYWV